MQVISRQSQYFAINTIFCNLNRSSSCHTLPEALGISRKTPPTSIVGSQSKYEFILCTINNCKIRESPVRKPN